MVLYHPAPLRPFDRRARILENRKGKKSYYLMLLLRVRASEEHMGEMPLPGITIGTKGEERNKQNSILWWRRKRNKSKREMKDTPSMTISNGILLLTQLWHGSRRQGQRLQGIAVSYRSLLLVLRARISTLQTRTRDRGKIHLDMTRYGDGVW